MNDIEDYNQTSFGAYPSPERHPDRIASVASLFGFTATSPNSCDILEIGCGTGGNIIPIAEQYPRSCCIGIDASLAQLNRAKNLASELHLNNLTLKHEDITQPSKSHYHSDYIICHGLYSWVNPQVQTAILELISKSLSPNGLALISFNHKAAWHIRSSILELLHEHDDLSQPNQERIQSARQFCAELLEQQIDDYTTYAMVLRDELEMVAKSSDALILHELLNPNTSWDSTHSFDHKLKSLDLAYVCDAKLFYKQIISHQNSTSMEVTQRSIENLLHPRKTHYAVICRCNSMMQIDREKAVSSLLFSSPHVPGTENSDTDSGIFLSPNGDEFKTRSPVTKSVLRILAEQWPTPYPAKTILKSLTRLKLLGTRFTKDEVIDALFHLTADGVITPHQSNLNICSTIPTHPLLRPYSRAELQSQNWTTNLRHEYSVLQPLVNRIANLCDGKTSVQQMTKSVDTWIQENTLELPEELLKTQNSTSSQKITQRIVEEAIESLFHSALLVCQNH